MTLKTYKMLRSDSKKNQSIIHNSTLLSIKRNSCNTINGYIFRNKFRFLNKCLVFRDTLFDYFLIIPQRILYGIIKVMKHHWEIHKVL